VLSPEGEKGERLTKMKDEILGIIKALGGGVTFVELSNRIQGFKGDLMWGVKGNIFFWPSLSQEAIDALEELNSSGLIELAPTSALTYIIDGTYPDMPIAKQVREYKSPRWLPVAFNLSTKD